MARNARAPDPCTERRDRQTADSAPAQRTTATSMTADARRRFSALRRNHWRRGALSHKGACVSHIRGPRLNYRLRYWLSTGRLSVRPFIASDEVSLGQQISPPDTDTVSHQISHQSVITRIVEHRRVIEASIVDDQTSSARALLAAINTASKLLAAVMITLQPATDSLGLTHTACRQR